MKCAVRHRHDRPVMLRASQALGRQSVDGGSGFAGASRHLPARSASAFANFGPAQLIAQARGGREHAGGLRPDADQRNFHQKAKFERSFKQCPVGKDHAGCAFDMAAGSVCDHA